MIIKGNTVGTTMPRTDFNQENPAKADYLKGRDDLLQLIATAKSAGDEANTAAGNAQSAANNAQTAANNAQAAADNAQTAADNHSADKENPHGVTPAQIGAVTEDQVNTMINDALGVIENGSY